MLLKQTTVVSILSLFSLTLAAPFEHHKHFRHAKRDADADVVTVTVQQTRTSTNSPPPILLQPLRPPPSTNTSISHKQPPAQHHTVPSTVQRLLQETTGTRVHPQPLLLNPRQLLLLLRPLARAMDLSDLTPNKVRESRILHTATTEHASHLRRFRPTWPLCPPSA